MNVLARLSLLLFAFGLRAETPVLHSDITVALDAPTPAFTLRIVRIDRKGDDVAVLAAVQPLPADMVMQVITPLSATARIEGAPTNVTRYLMGKTWNWENEGIADVKDEAAYAALVGDHVPAAFQAVGP